MTGTERPGGEETRLPVAAAIVDDNDDALSRWRRLLRRVSLNNLFSFPLSLSSSREIAMTGVDRAKFDLKLAKEVILVLLNSYDVYILSTIQTVLL